MWPVSALLRTLCRVAQRARPRACLPLLPSWIGLVRELPLCRLEVFGDSSDFCLDSCVQHSARDKVTQPIPVAAVTQADCIAFIRPRECTCWHQLLILLYDTLSCCWALEPKPVEQCRDLYISWAFTVACTHHRGSGNVGVCGGARPGVLEEAAGAKRVWK